MWDGAWHEVANVMHRERHGYEETLRTLPQ